MAKCASCGQSPCICDVTRTEVRPPSSLGRSGSAVGPAPEGPRFLPGQVLAERYRVVSVLGRGGMGEVYRADDLTLNQPVALKFLPPALAHNEDALRRFRNEVRIARQVSHPNVCRIYDIGEVGGQLFLSMEYVDGEDLASLLRRIGRLPEDKALEIARRLCAGLSAAHEKGILHRDLKPANVMLDGRGQVLLMDFGLAALATDIAGLEVRSGTPAYMAPEQLAGKEVTNRSDVYSLGVLLYELFSGKRPTHDGEPASLSSLIRDLDPLIERVVMRCLDPDPAERPSSAMAVAAALPGGDPLAAALAAGETPSPQMVAAAGEGAGLNPKIAIPLLALALIALSAHVILKYRASALQYMEYAHSPEVLAHRATELLAEIGRSAPVVDHAYGMAWNGALMDYLAKTKGSASWRDTLRDNPSVLRFWYRESPDTMVGGEFHDDLLTPGIVNQQDPAPIISGMIDIELDARGRLLNYRRMPPQKYDPEAPRGDSPDWPRLFALAGLNIADFKPAKPQWNWLEASDAKFAWTGKWPGTERPLRVEAASFGGKPVVFTTMNPWRPTNRTVGPSGDGGIGFFYAALAVITVIVLGGSALMARRNLGKGRVDRQGAARLAGFVFAAQMALWLARGHMVADLGTFGMFLVALATSSFYAAALWMIYLALEPVVRRYWPQTLISWSRALSGRIRDPIVGRDVLVAACVSLSWRLLNHGLSLISSGQRPWGVADEMLTGFRSSIGEALEVIPGGIRGALFYFFIIFILRVIFRNQWIAAGAFVALFTAMHTVPSSEKLISFGANLFVFGTVAFVILRFGLLALTLTHFISGITSDLPVTFDPTAWYFPSFVLLLGLVLLSVVWGFKQAIAGRQLWRQDLFG